MKKRLCNRNNFSVWKKKQDVVHYILMVWLLLYLYILYIKIFALMIFWWPLQSVWPAAQKLPYSIDYVHKRWALGTCMWTMETSTLPRCNGEPLPSICVSIKILPHRCPSIIIFYLFHVKLTKKYTKNTMWKANTTYKFLQHTSNHYV